MFRSGAQRCRADRFHQRPGDLQAEFSGIADASRPHPVVQAGDEDHHRISGARRNQAQQTDPFPLAERQIQDDDIVHMLRDAAARLFQRGGAVRNKTERRHRAGDDQALDGFIVDHQEVSSGVELRVHVISEVAR